MANLPNPTPANGFAEDALDDLSNQARSRADRSTRSARRAKKSRTDDAEPELKLTSMIDVIFQLLIYFVITANFAIDEGSILATLPGNAASTPITQTPEPIAVLIEVASADDGVTYTLRANGRSVEGVTQLHRLLESKLAQGMAPSDPVEIKPQGVVRWQHVVNVYNACVRADLKAVGFAPS